MCAFGRTGLIYTTGAFLDAFGGANLDAAVVYFPNNDLSV